MKAKGVPLYSIKVALWSALVCSAAAGAAAQPQSAHSEPQVVAPGRLWAHGTAVVAVSHPLAAQAGARVLAQGGNAVDAAAAIQFALNVVEPQFSGIGGGGFMLIHLAGHGSKLGQTFAIDSRERAPAAATPGMFQLTGVAPADVFTVASSSGVAVGVPGTLAGVDEALRRWGTQSLAATLQPAIELASKGFRINRFLAANIADDGGRTSFQPETAAIFRPGGVPLAEGSLLVQPDLARTFRLIAARGRKAFYRGEMAEAIVAAQGRTRTTGPGQVNAEGAGRMTRQDLADYRVVVRRPVTGTYRGWQVVSMAPPSSGGLALLQMLKLLERFPLHDASQGFGFGAPKTWHVMIEAMRLVFADRAVWMGDDDFVHVPQRGLLNPAYVEQRAALLSPDTRMATPAAGDPRPFEGTWHDAAVQFAPIEHEDEKGVHTTHFAVVDRWGNVVTYTSTIENTWGTGITVPGYGFLLNNELTDFNFTPSFDASASNPGANDVAPFKRPRSSMAPTLLLREGRPVVAYGSPGGATIINTVLNTTLNLIDHGMSLQQAIDAPRLSVTSAGGAVSCEGGSAFMQPPIAAATFTVLAGLGHLMPSSGSCTSVIGSVQAVALDPRSGGADPRREGTVISVAARRP